ncbi:hypothetical protein SARC_09697 [Sphaeroforma arctica JP610]|uniref:GPR1/FUN34/yaaH family protein n=1 Tax=Sphaeroforma arctica JP610 TaxID=667725 RepID=A0A0L0FM69_9EUKA|nr:hypothetical protein SARC_09697 [Sphaeroforma arctica JP610]KNC77855.1 hypothetical protein SARC_09697 [Sphaeroforma arctica JP610]|eukprot:XP_014151757.1 hypothetical protein SARC_09697 [Sphaeroforma arctica JP610]
MATKDEDVRSRTSLNMDSRTAAPPMQPRVMVPKGPANAGPIGLMAFGMTTVLLNFYNAGIAESGTVGLIACYGIMHGGFVQLLAGMWEISAGKVFTGTAFTSYGAFWMGLGLFDLLIVTNNLVPGDISEGKCVWLCIWGTFTFMMFMGTFRANRTVQFVFLSLALLFFLLAGGVYSDTVHKIAGAVGIVCGGSAMYLGWAELMNEVYQRDMIPIFKIKWQ